MQGAGPLDNKRKPLWQMTSSAEDSQGLSFETGERCGEILAQGGKCGGKH